MTGPPHSSGKTSPVRAGNPSVDQTSTSIFQLSLASVLPWLEAGSGGGDRAFKSNSVASNSNKNSGNLTISNTGNVAINPNITSGKNGSGNAKSKTILSAISSANHENKYYSGSASVVSPTGDFGNKFGSTSNKLYKFQFPLLHWRSSRPRDSVSSNSGVGVNGRVSPVTDSLHCLSLPLPSHVSLSGTQGTHERALVVRGRGLSRTPVDDTQPLDYIRDVDILTRSYVQNVQTALERQPDTPCSSGRSTPTITTAQTTSTISHSGWMTGYTTARSSVDSNYSLDDFDKQATNTVSQHFDDINSALFESSRESSVPQTDLARECLEWSSQFPHLRVLGKQMCPPKDAGYCVVPSLNSSRPTSSTCLLDAADNNLLCSDSLGLTLTGRSVSAAQVPVTSLSGSGDDPTSSFSFLVEEVIEEDGVYEDVIAVDYKKSMYEDSAEYKSQITPRRRRLGYPPITPSACVKDSVTSAAFDHVWQEIMSWMRDLLKKYTAEILDAHQEAVSPSPTNNSPPHHISREVSLLTTNSRQYSFQRSNTHLGSSNTDLSIDSILQISSMPLKNRAHGNQVLDSSEAPVPGTPAQAGPTLLSQPRPNSHLRLSRGVRVARLAPITKTSSFEDEKTNQSGTETLRVKGRNPMANEPSLSSNFQRNGSLPPLDIERTQHRKLHHPGYRAASATENKEMSFRSFRDRTHFHVDQARPNTTNAMRSDTFSTSGNHSRRSSTAMGNSYNLNSRNALLTNRSLDVRGNSLQQQHPGSDTHHIHPDIQEDQQESLGEDMYHTHWNGPQPSHIMYRRSRLSLR